MGLCCLLPACNTHSQATKQPDADTPISAPPMALVYDTASPQIKALIPKLNKMYDALQHSFSGGVLVGYKGYIIYERYMGYSDKAQGKYIDANTSIQLASTSKTFTGTAILYLYQRHKIDIDKTVNSYIPSFPYPDITVRMLLCHRSGLPDYTHWAAGYGGEDNLISNLDLVNLFAERKPRLHFKPNTHFAYSNSNYAMLARLIEVVSGMSYPQFMKKYIFAPLGMEHTFVYEPKVGLPTCASCAYKGNWIKADDMFADGVFGDKGIYSTPQDMYRWDQSFYQYKLIDSATTRLAYTPCSFEHKGVKNYALGWRTLTYPNGDQIIYHNGWWHGNNTSFYRFVKDNFTIVVLGNRFNKGIYSQAAHICAIINGVAANEDMQDED